MYTIVVCTRFTYAIKIIDTNDTLTRKWRGIADDL